VLSLIPPLLPVFRTESDPPSSVAGPIIDTGLVPGVGPAFPLGVQRAYLLLIGVTLLGTVAAVVLLWGVFWFLLETVRLALGGPNPLNPAVALLPAGIAACSLLYLSTDHLGMFGTGAAHRILIQKAKRYFGPEQGLPPVHFFVEARIEQGKTRFVPDFGILCFFAEHLIFVGDLQIVTVPRLTFTGSVTRDRSMFHMMAAWLTLEMGQPNGKLRLLCREDATRLSDTHVNAERLEKALAEWFRA
jgi:hypothetical protein